MRSNGVNEEYITGSAPDEERIAKFAEALEMAIGNPMYHWTNMELHKFFGVADVRRSGRRLSAAYKKKYRE